MNGPFKVCDDDTCKRVHCAMRHHDDTGQCWPQHNELEAWKVYEAYVRARDRELRLIDLNHGLDRVNAPRAKNPGKLIAHLVKHGMDAPEPGSHGAAIWALNAKWGPVLDVYGDKYDHHPSRRKSTLSPEVRAKAEVILKELEATVSAPGWKSIQ